MKFTSGYNLLPEYDEIVKRGIIERRGRTGRGTVYVLKGSNDSMRTSGNDENNGKGIQK